MNVTTNRHGLPAFNKPTRRRHRPYFNFAGNRQRVREAIDATRREEFFKNRIATIQQGESS